MYTITLLAATATGYDKALVYSWDCPFCTRKVYTNLDLEYVRKMAISHMINGHNTEDKFLRVIVDLPGREEEETINDRLVRFGIHTSHRMRPSLRLLLCDRCFACGCHDMSQLLSPCIGPAR